MKEVKYHKDCSFLMVNEGRSPEEETIYDMSSEISRDAAMEYRKTASPDTKTTSKH